MPVIFPVPFPLFFGGELVAEELQALEGTELARIESHCDEGLALFLQQFRDKPRLEALTCRLLDTLQEVEDAFWAILIGRGLADAIGAQLDGIGLIVNLPRQGWNDATYRALLFAQILTLRSCGTWPDLFKVLGALGHDIALAEAHEHYPAAARFVAGDPPLDGVTGEDEFNMLDRARAEGVRFFFEFPVVDVDETFAWADDATASQADTARGWADDDASQGGYWADSFATTESE